MTLNDPIFVEASRFFAERIIQEGGSSFADKVNFAAKTALARPLEKAQIKALEEFYKRRLEDFNKDPKAAEALLSIGDTKRNTQLNIAEHASWTLIAQLVLNLDENLNKE